MSYPETLNYIMQQLPMYQRVGAAAYKADLNTTLALLEATGNPQHSFPSIHVAGTNGKGSVSHLLASCLQEAGFKTGLYTSPHLKDFRERIRIEGMMISEKDVIQFVNANRSLFDTLKPSFFEMSVALAFEHFRKQEVDIAVIEAGMGGRLDSTNVIHPLLSIITNIGHDHMQFLGGDLGSIAREKAGIMKTGVPVLIGETLAETMPVFAQAAIEKGAYIQFSEEEARISPLLEIPGQEPLVTCDISLKTGRVLKQIICPLTGWYQRNNFRLVVHALHVIAPPFQPDSAAILRGFRKVKTNTGLRGRWEVLGRDPLIIADTAHNQEGLEAAMKQWMALPGKTRHIVLGMVDDKDLSQILSIFPRDARYYYCRPDVPRGMNVDKLQEAASHHHLKGRTFTSVSLALRAARNAAIPEDIIYVGGSTFVVAEII